MGSMCGGKGKGSRTRRSSNLAMSLDFQSRRWTCHVPKAKAVRGIRATNRLLAVEHRIMVIG